MFTFFFQLNDPCVSTTKVFASRLPLTAALVGAGRGRIGKHDLQTSFSKQVVLRTSVLFQLLGILSASISDFMRVY